MLAMTWGQIMFRARVRKLPAVNAMRCLCSDDEASCPMTCATATPRTQVSEARKFQKRSCATGKPAVFNTMKSPSSCGNSCAATAMVASTPAVGPARKERPNGDAIHEVVKHLHDKVCNARCLDAMTMLVLVPFTELGHNKQCNATQGSGDADS